LLSLLRWWVNEIRLVLQRPGDAARASRMALPRRKLVR